MELEEAQEARPRPDAALVRSLTVASEDMDALLNHAADLLHHLTGLETALTPPEARRHRFWVEAHRSRIQRLFDQVLSARLVPFEVLSERVARGARDVEARLGKKVRFETEGVDQAVDRSLLEKLLDPLTHLVRNAVDHGIEAPEERVRAGKPEAGRLQLTVHREADALIVSLADDGRGMDPEAIRRAAVERGLFTVQEASLLDTPRLFRLLTTPAFSTRSEVTEVSGRGVGLDVVLASVESLGGHLDIASEQGKGSTFTLVIPSAATLTRILTFGWDAVPARLALPTSQVLHIYPLASHPLVWAGSRRCLQAGEELLPVLGWRLGPVGRDGCAMRLASPAGDRVLLVSRVHQTERVVVQPLGPPLDRVPGWVGAALLTTGHIAYVLDARVLVRREEENHV